MAQAFQIQPDNDPRSPPVLASAAKGALILSAPVGANHTLMSALSNTLHGAGAAQHNIGV